MTLKISISGVRGLVPETLTPEVCLHFAKAFGTYLTLNQPPAKRGASSKKKNIRVVIGTDSRASSEFIKGIVFSGLSSTGCEVIDLRICPTPTVGVMVRELAANGGIVITASHNPLPWNGLKFMREDGIFLNEAQANRLIALYNEKTFIKGTPQKVYPDHSAINTHIKKILKVIKALPIRLKRFKVGVDSGNGAGSLISLQLLKKLGCKVEAIHCQTSLPFPRPPEPTPENLAELCQLVKSKKLDVGFAFDSDADRLAIVTNDGIPAGEELTLALAVKLMLSQNKIRSKEKKIIVVNLSTTRAIEDLARPEGGTVLRTKIGEVNVSEELKSLRGLIGGEGNGGVIYPPIGFNRDALAAMAMILSLMAKTNQTISSLVGSIPSYHIVKQKIDCASKTAADEMIDNIKDKFKGSDLVLTEGVKVVLKDGWVHVRPSNTEPIIRVIAESKSEEEAKALVKRVLD